MPVAHVRSAKVHAPTTTHKPAPAKLPTKAQLNDVLGAWGFQSRNNPQGVFRNKTAPKELKPANIAKDIVLSKPGNGDKMICGGSTVTAHVLKGSPTQVIYEQTKAGVAPEFRTRYFGPVRTDILPK